MLLRVEKRGWCYLMQGKSELLSKYTNLESSDFQSFAVAFVNCLLTGVYKFYTTLSINSFIKYLLKVYNNSMPISRQWVLKNNNKMVQFLLLESKFGNTGLGLCIAFSYKWLKQPSKVWTRMEIWRRQETGSHGYLGEENFGLNGTARQCLQGLEMTKMGENMVRNEIEKYHVGLFREFM